MIHGKHNGVPRNFQTMTPMVAAPNIIPISFGSMMVSKPFILALLTGFLGAAFFVAFAD
jgi:hypothetical protein